MGVFFVNYVIKFKFFFCIDDVFDIFVVYGIGGFVGNICIVFFVINIIICFDGVFFIKGGWFDYNWIQFFIQFVDFFVGGVYFFVLICVIFFIFNFIFGFYFCVSEESEIFGIDDVEIGEFVYDYVELIREVFNDVEGDNMSFYSVEQFIY